MMKPVNEICNECGQSVKCGSGRFVNRILDCNTVTVKRKMGKPFPEGDFICEDCFEENDRPVLEK